MRFISRLVSSQGRDKLEIYQFEDEDLRDYFGEQQTFIRRAAVTAPDFLFNIQIAKDIQLTATIPEDECFYKQGARILKHFKAQNCEDVKDRSTEAVPSMPKEFGDFSPALSP